MFESLFNSTQVTQTDKKKKKNVFEDLFQESAQSVHTSTPVYQTMGGKPSFALKPIESETQISAAPEKSLLQKAVDVYNEKIKPIITSPLNPLNPKTLMELPKTVHQQYTQPSKPIKQAESLLGYTTTGNKLADVATAPIRTIGKAFIRTFGPMLEPYANNVGQALATNNIADQVAKGKLPPTVLDDLDTLNKSNLQIVGDAIQVGLALRVPSFLGKTTATGGVAHAALEVAKRTALQVGVPFGVAQILSSGANRPEEIIPIMTQSIIGAAGLGAVTGGAVGILKKISEVKPEIKTLEVQKPLQEIQLNIAGRVSTQEIAGLLEMPKENALLKAPSKTVFEGEGFTMTTKADKAKVEFSKSLQDYQSKLDSYNKEPTPTKLIQVLDLKQKIIRLKVETENRVVSELPAIPEQPLTQKPELIVQKELQIKPETIKVSQAQLPVGEGELKASKLEARIKNKLDAVLEKENITTYKEMNKVDQIKKAVEYVQKNPSEALIVLEGKKSPPKDILYNSIFLAMEEVASDNAYVGLKLASLRSTRAGQEISILTERDPHSPVKYMNDLVNQKIEALGGNKEYKTIQDTEVSTVKKSMQKSNLAKTDWTAFIDSIMC